MTAQTIYSFPEEDLRFGKSIPPGSIHGTSVSFPKLAHVIGYEERDPEVMATLDGGYPRFVFQKCVKQLCELYGHYLLPGEKLVVFPSQDVAKACVDFVQAGRVLETQDDVWLAVVPEDKHNIAHKFWQHTGQIVSSRQALDILDQEYTPVSHDIYDRLKDCIAKLQNTNSDNVYIFPTGMAAIYAAYKAVSAKRGCQTIQFGFPYTDTMAIHGKFGVGAKYIQYNNPKDLNALIGWIDENSESTVSAVFCEIPGNPLLKTIDLQSLSRELKDRGIPLIVDNTLGFSQNVDVMPYADVIVTSLTKIFSGKADVMGGSVVLNPDSEHYGWLKKMLDKGEQLLYPADAAVLLNNAADIDARVQDVNHNALLLAEVLRKHPAVAEVFYTDNDPAYEAIRKEGGGYGGLLSFTLKDPSMLAEVYDALRVPKGPSLGADFTLVCPYTILAHFDELDKVAESGVPAGLLRVSIGREDAQEIITRFYEALDYAILKPNEPRSSRSETVYYAQRAQVIAAHI